jgi:hypothetical protein
MGLNEVPDMTHIEEEKVTTTTTYEDEDPPKEQVKNVNMNVVTDNNGETVTVDEVTTVDEATEEPQPNVNINVSR